MSQLKVCKMCGFEGYEKKRTKGYFILEVVLWCMAILPGLIYSIWRLSTKEKVCPNCGHNSMVPLTKKNVVNLVAEKPWYEK